MDPVTYLESAVQRFTEVGGFSRVEAESLPPLTAHWAEAVLERREPGLVSRILFLPLSAGSLLAALRDELAAELAGAVGSGRTEALGVLLLIAGERIDRAAYDRAQGLIVQSGRVRVVPAIADLERGRVFGHEGPPFGIDPDLYRLASPAPDESAPPVRTRAAGARRSGPLPWVTVGLAAILVALWLVMTVQERSLTATEDTETLRQWGGALRPMLIQDREYWRLFTAGFLHIGIGHLVMNVLSLWWVGQITERLYGRLRMLAIYLIALVAGSAFSLLFGPPVTLSAGASGAVSGLIGALIWYRWRGPERQRLAQIPILLVAGITLFGGLFFNKNIDTWNHIGGLIGGMLGAAAAGFPLKESRRLAPALAHGAVTLALLGLAGATTLGFVSLPGPSQRMARALDAWESGRYGEAQRGLEAVAAEDPEDVYPQLYLAWFYYDLRAYGKAQATLERILKLDPANESARDLRRKLPPADSTAPPPKGP